VQPPTVFRRTVHALTLALLPGRVPATARASDDAAAGRVSDFVLRQTHRMPGYLRWGIIVATLGFFSWSIVRTGRRADRLSTERLRRLLAGWRRSRIGVLRDFVRFYETLVVFAAVSEQRP